MLKLLTALAMALGAPTLALAATDGTLGDSSSGIADITLNVIDEPTSEIQITGLQDMAISHAVGDAAPAEQAIDLCVYMDFPGTYSLQIQASPLQSDRAGILPYSIAYRDTVSDTTFSGTATNSALTTIVFGSDLSPSNVLGCANVNAPATLTLGVPTPPSEDAIATSTIKIVVSPD